MKGETCYGCLSEGMKVAPGVGDKIRAGAKPNETVRIATVVKVLDDLSGAVADSAKGKVARSLKEAMNGVEIEKDVGEKLKKGMVNGEDHIRRTILADVFDQLAGVKKEGKGGQVAQAVAELEKEPAKE